MAEQYDFLKAILADPADDSVRLIYADHLEESGDAGRARLIRWQCKTGREIRLHPSRNRTGPRGWCFVERPPRWTRAVAASILPPPDRDGPVITRATVSRGFVEEVECVAAFWLARGAEILRSQPVTRVRLTTAPDIRIERRAVRREANPIRPTSERLVIEARVCWGDLKPLVERFTKPLSPSVSEAYLRRELEVLLDNFLALPGLLSRQNGWFPGVTFELPEPSYADEATEMTPGQWRHIVGDAP